jgi:DNA (cytosine-5)-methyltransferase 1
MVITIGTDCSGIEAPIIAFKKLKIKHEHIFSCDYDKHVRQAIKGNFNPKTIYEDITNRDHNNVLPVDFYFCGFPCQSFSSAGKKAGFNDPRGTIFFHCHKYISLKKPKAFVLENVKGLVNHDNGNTFKIIMEMCDSLTDYNIFNKVLNSKHFNIPQNRERIFIIGIKKDLIVNEFKFPSTIEIHPGISYLLESTFFQKKENNLTKWELNNLQHFIDKYLNKTPPISIEDSYYILDIGASEKFASIMHNISPCLKASRSNYYITNLQRKLSPRECLRLQGIPDNLFKQICSDHQTYKQAGNSITVNVLEAIIKELFNSLNIPLN